MSKLGHTLLQFVIRLKKALHWCASSFDRKDCLCVNVIFLQLKSILWRTKEVTGYAGSRDYAETPPSLQKTQHHPTEKQTPTRSGCELFEVTSNPHRTLARGSEFVFQWGFCLTFWKMLNFLQNTRYVGVNSINLLPVCGIVG